MSTTAEELSIQRFMRCFEEKLAGETARAYGIRAGDEPYYPMLLVFLGETAINTLFPYMAEEFGRLWPQFKSELLFLGMPQPDGALSVLSLSDGQARREAVEPERQGTVISRLFEKGRTHFQSYGHLLAYFILDTAECISAQALTDWAEAVRAQCASLEDDPMRELSALSVIWLDERYGRSRVSQELRGCLAAQSEQGARRMVVLSNVTTEKNVVDDPQERGKLCTALIALSNTKEQNVFGTIFGRGLATVSYGFKAKPNEAISQFFVRSFLERLASAGAGGRAPLSPAELEPERLGLSERNTLQILDDYCTKELDCLLPTPEQLSLFPRQGGDDTLEHCSSAEQFDEETMGAWSAYLRRIERRVDQRAQEDSTLLCTWRKAYGDFLQDHFSAGELIALSDNLPAVAQRFSGILPPSPQEEVLAYARQCLRCALSSCEEYREVFLEEIRERGHLARAYQEAWGRLADSLRAVHSVNEGREFREFYGGRFRDYYGINEDALVNRFRLISDVDHLLCFIREEIDAMFRDEQLHAVFHAGFEEELAQRLNRESDAYRTIRQQLTNIPRFLVTRHHLGSPVLSAIFLKMDRGDAPFYRWMKEEDGPSSGTIYYDTGIGSEAQALSLYLIEPRDLPMGEED